MDFLPKKILEIEKFTLSAIIHYPFHNQAGYDNDREVILKIEHPNKSFDLKLKSELNPDELSFQEEIIFNRIEAYQFNSAEIDQKLLSTIQLKKKVMILQELLLYISQKLKVEKFKAESFIEWHIFQRVKDKIPQIEDEMKARRTFLKDALLSIIQSPNNLDILFNISSDKGLNDTLDKLIKWFDENNSQIQCPEIFDYIFKHWLGFGNAGSKELGKVEKTLSQMGIDYANPPEKIIKHILLTKSLRCSKDDSTPLAEFVLKHNPLRKNQTKLYKSLDYLYVLNGLLQSLINNIEFSINEARDTPITKEFINVLSKGGFNYKVYTWKRVGEIPAKESAEYQRISQICRDDLYNYLLEKKAIPKESVKSRLFVYLYDVFRNANEIHVYFDYLTEDLKLITHLPTPPEDIAQNCLLKKTVVPNPSKLFPEKKYECFDPQDGEKKKVYKASVPLKIKFDWCDVWIPLSQEQKYVIAEDKFWPQCFYPIKTDNFFVCKQGIKIFHDQEEAERECPEISTKDEDGKEMKIKVMLKLRYDKRLMKNDTITSRGGYFAQALIFKKFLT